MPSEFAFRLSTYLTLALSCLCLGYAEYDLLPESMVITGAVLFSLGFSFWADGRYLLDLQAANRVGLVILLIVGAWMTYQFVNENSPINRISLPAGMLPLLGPLLMILMPAKLFRPKHVGDWWAMQGIALAGASLASAMSEDEVFGILLALYAISGVTSLVLFYYRRTANTLPPVPNTDAGAAVEILADPARHAASGRAVTRRVVGWLAVSFLVALPLFFVTPRSQSVPLKMRGSRMETGFGSDQTVDLTRTGTLEINREIAYEVRATDRAGQPKLDLSPAQRWRGYSFTYYDSGKWSRGDNPILYANGITPIQVRTATEPFQHPDFGPNQVAIDFSPRVRAFEAILADPVVWEIDQPSPVSAKFPSGDVRPWWQSPDTTIRPIGVGPGRSYQYRQLTRMPVGADPDLSPAFELSPPVAPAFQDPTANYRQVRLPKLRTWTRELLVRLAKTQPRLAVALARSTDRVAFEVAPEDYEAVGRAFCDYLKNSGDYEYTLTLRRTDKNADPVEDFLMKTKSGHCERFATALVLMLRAVNVPAVYVLGFKGCDAEGEGIYLIRQEHAHGWVEILVPRPAPPGFPFVPKPEGAPRPTTVWHWLSLDPTPDGGGEEPGITSWLDNAKTSGVAFFLDFIVGYNAERRIKTVEAIQQWLQENALRLSLVPVLLVGLAFARRAWRNRRTAAKPTGTLADADTGTPWFDDYISALKRHGFRAPLGATAAEFAVEVSQALRSRPGCAEVHDIPLDVTKAFYLVRYARQLPTEAERVRLAESIARLTAALRRSLA